MQVYVSELRRVNIGQTITMDIVNDDGEDAVVVGVLEAFERDSSQMVITIAGSEFDIGLDEQVDIALTYTDRQLAQQLREIEALSRRIRALEARFDREEVMSVINDALEPGSEVRTMLDEIVRESAAEAVRSEMEVAA